MSYAALGLYSFGAGFGAADARNCAGALLAEENTPDEGECCPMDEWTNATYGAVMGYTTLRHWKEARVAQIVSPLASPSPPDATGLQKLAYDLGLPPPDASFVQRLQRAATNFGKLYPSGRWGPDPKEASTDEANRVRAAHGCGPYHGWTIVKQFPWTPDRLSALSNVVGKAMPATMPAYDLFNPFITAAQGTPPLWQQALIAWIQKANAVIDSVVSPGLRVGTKYHGLLWKNYVTSVGGKIAPIPWLQQFMDVFAPSQVMLKPAALMTLTAMKPKISTAALAQKFSPLMTPTAAETQAPSRPEEPSGMGTWLLIGGAVVIAAGGYYYYTKKKKAPTPA